MNKIETNFENLKEDILQFYEKDKHHFISMNGVDLGENQIEYQWFFCDYAYPAAETIFFTVADANTVVPSLKEVVDSAWVAEAELVDLLGIQIDGIEKGFVLEPDFQTAPLRKK